MIDQQAHWDRALRERPNRYGEEPSAPALAAAELFRRESVSDILELGAGQGRDTFFFARLGLRITATDFAPSAIATLRETAATEGLSTLVATYEHDAREPLPFPNGRFGGCYSHMLFNMALTRAELQRLADEIHRVLSKDGVCVYTARTTEDPDFGKGIHRGEDMYELDGFVVHFFSPGLVAELGAGFTTLEIADFEEGALPRKLVRVSLRKE